MASPNDPVWREGRLRNENEAAPAPLSMAAQAALRGLIGNDIGPASPQEVALQNYVNANSDPHGRPSPQILAQFQTATGGQPPLGEVSGMPAGQPLPMPPAPGQIMPPAPQPQAPGAPQIQHDPRIAALEQERQRALASTQAGAQPWERARESAFTDLQQAGGELGAVRPPRLEGLPTYHPAPVDPEQFTNFGAAATVFASLASLLTRQPLTAALNAAGRAMQGYSSGRFAQIDSDIKVFRTEFDSAMARNRQSIEEYNAILSDKKLNFATREAVLKAAAAGQGDEITRGLLQVGKIDDFIKLLDARDRSENTLRMQYENINQHMQAAQMRAGQGAGGAADPAMEKSIDDMAHYLIMNGRIPVGMSRSLTPAMMQEIQKRASEVIRGAGMGPQDFALAGPITKQKLVALSALEKQRNAIQAFEQMLDLNVGTLKQLSEEVGRTDSARLNRPLLWLQQNLAGDPKVAEYLFQAEIVSTEAARIINNPNLTGQLTDTAREELRGVIRGDLSPAQLNAVLDRASADAKNRAKALDTQVNKLIGEIRAPLSSGTLGTAGGGTAAPTTPRSFATEAEAEAAMSAGQIKSGDSITIGGRKARVP